MPEVEAIDTSASSSSSSSSSSPFPSSSEEELLAEAYGEPTSATPVDIGRGATASGRVHIDADDTMRCGFFAATVCQGLLSSGPGEDEEEEEEEEKEEAPSSLSGGSTTAWALIGVKSGCWEPTAASLLSNASTRSSSAAMSDVAAIRRRTLCAGRSECGCLHRLVGFQLGGG